MVKGYSSGNKQETNGKDKSLGNFLMVRRKGVSLDEMARRKEGQTTAGRHGCVVNEKERGEMEEYESEDGNMEISFG